MFFKKNKNKAVSSTVEVQGAVVCLEIDTTVVRSALVQMEASNSKIIRVATVPLALNITFDSLKDNLTMLEHACRQAVKETKANLDFKLEALAVGISGDLIKGITQTTQTRRQNTGVVFNEQELDQLVLQNQTESLNQVLSDLKFEHQAKSVRLQLLNSSLIGLALDHQPVINPIGQPANFVAIQLYNVFIPTTWAEITQELATRLNLRLISLAYKPFALSRGLLGNEAQSDLNALLVYIEAHMTHIILIRQGVLVKTQHFSLGEENFNQALMRHLKLDWPSVGSLKSVAGDFDFSSLSANQQAIAHKVLNHTVSVWLQGLILLLKDFGSQVLPSRIYLAGSPAGWSAIHKSLQQKVLMKILPLQTPPVLEVLDFKDMPQVNSDLDYRQTLSSMVLAGLGCLAGEVLGLEVAQTPGQQST